MADHVAADQDVYQMIVRHSANGQSAYNVLWFRATGTPTVETDLIGKYISGLNGFLWVGRSTELKFVSIVARRLIPSLGEDIVHVPASQSTGGAGTQMLPTQCCNVVNLISERAGRKGRGRIYVMAAGESETAQSVITSAFQTIFNNWLTYLTTNFVTVASANRWNLGVFSRSIGGHKLPYNAAGFSPVRTLTLNPIIATLRTRKLGHGV